MITRIHRLNDFIDLKTTVLLGGIYCLCISSWALSSPEADYTQNVKAVFVYNFSKYMDWIDRGHSSTFNIAVIGESRIIDPLRQIAQKRRVNQQVLQIKRFKNAGDVDSCQILFIPESEKVRLSGIVNRIRDKNILIVSETDGALTSGVMINFLISRETIRFEINLRAMKKSGFQPSSELLKLAVRVIE
jgi:hypothetical protein